MAKTKGQRLPSGATRVQVRDPLNPEKRISMTGGDPTKLLRRAAEVRQVRDDLRNDDTTAEQARADLQRRLGGVVRFDAAWRAYLATLKGRWEAQAKATWTHRLAPTFGEMACVEATESVVRAWEADQLAQGLAPATVNNAGNLLRAIVNLQIRDGRLRQHPWGTWKPCKAIVKRRREACRSIEELEMLVVAARRRDEKLRAIGRYADLGFRVLIMALCGLRQGEASGLGWADVEIDAPIPLLRVWRQATDGWRTRHPEWGEPQDPVKGRQGAVQRLHGSAVQALRHQRENLEAHGLYKPTGPVFPGRGAEWRSHADCIDAEDFRQIVIESGLANPEKWVPHSLRHSFGTLELIASGGDLKSTMARMRHTRIETLETYLHEMGRGLPVSRVPELNPAAMPEPPPRQLPPARPVPPELAPFAVVEDEAERMGDLVTATGEAAQTAEERRLERKARLRREAKQRFYKRNIPSFKKALDAWDRQGPRPPEITAHAERARMRARAKYLRDHPGEEARANLKGRAAFNAVIAAWGGFMKRQRGGTPEQLELKGGDDGSDKRDN